MNTGVCIAPPAPHSVPGKGFAASSARLQLEAWSRKQRAVEAAQEALTREISCASPPSAGPGDSSSRLKARRCAVQALAYRKAWLPLWQIQYSVVPHTIYSLHAGAFYMTLVLHT